MNNGDETIFFWVGVGVSVTTALLLVAFFGTAVHNINPQKVADSIVACQINDEGTATTIMIKQNKSVTVMELTCSTGQVFKSLVD